MKASTKFINRKVCTNSPVSKVGAGVFVEVSAKLINGKAKNIKSQKIPGASSK
jgi:hypothetical protein